MIYLRQQNVVLQWGGNCMMYKRLLAPQWWDSSWLQSPKHFICHMTVLLHKTAPQTTAHSSHILLYITPVLHPNFTVWPKAFPSTPPRQLWLPPLCSISFSHCKATWVLGFVHFVTRQNVLGHCETVTSNEDPFVGFGFYLTSFLEGFFFFF